MSLSTASDWYSTKDRVDFYLQQANIVSASVDNFIMDDAYVWVNGELGKKGINAYDASVAADLKTQPQIRQAMTWYACFLVIRTINANLNVAALVPDANITSQSLGQGDQSVGYSPAETPKDEKPTPDYYHMAERALNSFFANVADQFSQPIQSIMSVSNAFRREGNPASEDYANRLRNSNYRTRRRGRY